MPTYTFRDKNTEQVFEKFMKISEREQYLQDNPHLEQCPSPLTLGDPVRLGIRKIDGGFKEVLQKIHSRAPGSTLNRTANI